MIGFARALPAVSFAILLAGCAGSASEDVGTGSGAATDGTATDGTTPTPTSTDTSVGGLYSGHMRGWDGSLAITSVTPDSLAFDFDISPDDLDTAPIGRLAGTAVRVEGGYRYVDGRCTVDFEPVKDGPGAARGDLFVDASLTCAILLGLDGHTTVATALDFTATWRRVAR